MAGWRFPGLTARPRFTSRATVLVLVLCSLVAILAYPTRQFISQRSEIAAQRARAEHARLQVDQLRREKARWQDPEYVKSQARARLHYALPGEVPFVAADPSGTGAKDPGPAGAPNSGAPASGSGNGSSSPSNPSRGSAGNAAGSPANGAPAGAANGAARAPVKAAQPWYTTLWHSVDAADAAVEAAALAPPPVGPPPPAGPVPSSGPTPAPAPASAGDSSPHDH